MAARTLTVAAHPSTKPAMGVILDWFQSGGVVRGRHAGRRIRTSRVVARYRIGRTLYVETLNSVYELRHGLRWGRERL